MRPDLGGWKIVCVGALVLLYSASLFSQTPERLFCGNCGVQNDLTARYCSSCGELLDKDALIERLRARLAQADSLNVPLTLTADEIRVLVQAEATQPLAPPPRRVPTPKDKEQKTALENALDGIAPVAIAVGGMYLAAVFLNVMLLPPRER